MKRARCAWGAMVVSVVLLPVLGVFASIQHAATEENLRVLAETDKNLAVVQQLLDRGVNPNAVDWRGRTAVHVAARHGAAKNLHALLQAGGGPNVQDQDGNTPLHVAIREGESNEKVSVVKALLAGHADPCIRDAKGHTSYHVSSDQDGVRQEIDRARGHARVCDDQPEVAQTNQARSAAPTNVGQAGNTLGDPWGRDGGTYQDVWGRTLSTEADPWGISDTPWSQDDEFADGLTDEESAEDEEADADYTAALKAAMGEAAEQETQKGDYLAALTQLERKAEERRQAELARQRAEAEERRQAELARQRAEAEERRQAAEREAEWQEQEEREEREWRQQQREAMDQMWGQIQERNNQMMAAIQRGEDPSRALRDQLLREQGLGELVELQRRKDERRQQEAKQRQEEYNRQVVRQQEEYERQRQEAGRKAEQRRREAERERERQRQAQAEQRQQAKLRAKLRAATADQCIKTRQLKGGFNVADEEMKNACSQEVNVTMACNDGQYTANYPFKGTYSFYGGGMTTLSPSQGWYPVPSADICKREGYEMAYIACVVPYTAYFTSPDASTYRCFD